MLLVTTVTSEALFIKTKRGEEYSNKSVIILHGRFGLIEKSAGLIVLFMMLFVI